MHRFWFTFDVSWPPTSQDYRLTSALLLQGVGVTGFDEADCLSMVLDIVPVSELPQVIGCIPDVFVPDVMVPGRPIGVPVWRGVWYPPINLGQSGIWRPVGAPRALNPSVWPPNSQGH